MTEKRQGENSRDSRGGSRSGSVRESRRQTGTDYERAAGYYLEQLGYEILEYNYRCRAGEIDLVARDGDYLVFCEVKYRRTAGKGGALDAVTCGKQRTISKCALFYLMEHHLTGAACRFDVVGIEGAAEKITLVKGAFEYEE